MPRRIPWLTAFLLSLIAVAAYLRTRPHPQLATPAPALAGAPRLILWAWETPEDLRLLDPQHAGVAYLSEELLLGRTAEVRPRRQPLLLPPHTFLIPVVRIETTPTFPWSTADIPAIATQIATQPAEAANPTHALQIDFDARASERPFYAILLRSLRQKLPPATTLSITALTSWCGRDSWLHNLPIDEAVPMFFRMGGPSQTRAAAPRTASGIEEPLCTGSIGVSTDEHWPAIDPRQRLYVFRPGSWRAEDLAFIHAGRYPQLQSLPHPSTPGP